MQALPGSSFEVIEAKFFLQLLANYPGFSTIGAGMHILLTTNAFVAALTAVLLGVRPELRDRLPRARTLLSIHNLAYQGRGPRALLGEMGLPTALAGNR